MHIRPQVQEQFEELVNIRRELHEIPGYSFDVQETYDYLMEYLRRLCPDILEPCAQMGIKVVFFAEKPEKTVAMRADIDGLRVPEHTGLAYASRNENTMHACGHDAHMAIALICAKLISEHKNRKYNYVFLFQPAEETVGGAQPMIEAGALQNPQVDEIYGIHLWPDVPLGTVATRPGPLMAQMCDFKIDIKGRASHGAKPQAGIDALVAAAQFVSGIQTIVSRSVDPYETAVVTIGRIEGGNIHNVICENVHLEGTMRAFEPDVMALLKQRMRAMLDGIETMYGVVTEYDEPMGYPAVINDEALYEQACVKFAPDEMQPTQPFMMAEDFSNYQRCVPGLYTFVGIGEGEGTPPLHSSAFNFNERALLNGVEYFLRVIDFE